MRSNLAIAAIAALLSWSAQGQTLLVVTNARLDVANDPAYTLTGPAGAFRITYTVTAGGTPINLNDNSTFRQYVYASDGHMVQSNANSTTPEVSLDNGQTKYLMNTLGAGTYRVRVIATPVSGDTNANWNVAHHWLTVTASVAAASTVNINSGAVQVAALTVDLISINSASISNAGDLWIGGTLTAGGLNVTGAVAVIDTGAVRKVGGELTGGLTNRSAGGFVGNGIGLTNVQASISTAMEGTGNVVTNLAAGGGVVTGQLGSVSSGAGGTLQWYTNAYGPHFTNSAGNIEWLEGPYMGAAPSYFQDFDALPATMSNRNATWTHYVTNGSLVIVVPNETTGLRQYDYKTVTSGTWWRAAAKINGYPIRTTATGSGQTQAGLSVHLHNGTNMMWGISSSAAQPTFRLANYTAGFGTIGTPFGVAPYDNTGASMFPDRSPNNQDWLLMDHDGTSVWRCFTARGIHSPELALMVTNVGWTVQAIALGVQSISAGTGRSTNSVYEIDSWQYQEGVLWLPATTP